MIPGFIGMGLVWKASREISKFSMKHTAKAVASTRRQELVENPSSDTPEYLVKPPYDPRYEPKF